MRKTLALFLVFIALHVFSAYCFCRFAARTSQRIDALERKAQP